MIKCVVSFEAASKDRAMLEVMSDEQVEQRWGFLSRWWVIVKHSLEFTSWEHEGERWGLRRRCLEVRLPSLQDDYGDTVSITGFDAEDHQTSLQWTREALSLLAIVAHLDYHAWRYILECHCGLRLGGEGEAQYEEEIPIQFMLKLASFEQTYIDMDADSFHDDLVMFCGTHQRQHHSRPYTEALGKIAALNNDKAALDVNVPVRVYFSSVAVWRQTMSMLLEVSRAEKTIKREWENYDAGAPGTPRCTFQLEPMLADFNSDPITPGLADTVQTLVDGNVWFSQFSLQLALEEELAADAFSSKEVAGLLMSRLFSSTRRNRPLHSSDSVTKANKEASRRQVDAIHMLCQPSIRIQPFEALCSALVVNQTARKLSLRLWMDRSDVNASVVSSIRWGWLAYAVFSKRARECSLLKSLALFSVQSLTVAEMEIFVSILESEHPEEELFGYPHGQIEDRDATLRAGARVIWHFDNQGKPLTGTPLLTFGAEVAFLRTFSDDRESEWVNAVIPAYGHCQVKRNDLVFLAPFIKERPCRGGITSLTIGFDILYGSTSHGLPLVLKAIGTSLKSLTLTGPRVKMDNNVILRCCPMLEDLVLGEYYVDVRLDFREYRSSNRSVSDVNCDWNDTTSLAVELSKIQNPLTRCVRRLRVRLKNKEDGLSERLSEDDYHQRMESQLVSLLRMLETNRSLEYLEVVVPPDYDDYFDDFRDHHHEPICRPLNPLPIQNKLAFLSVLRFEKPLKETSKKAKGRGARSLPGLDQNVLSEIFFSAAEPVLREVFFREGTGDGRDGRDQMLL